MTRAVCAAVLCAAAVASAKDAKGCRDLDLVPRMPGAEISSCEAYFWAEDEIYQQGDRRGRVAGDYQRVDYKQKEASAAETVKNYEVAVSKVGFVKQSDYTINPVQRVESLLLDKDGKKIWFQVLAWDDGKAYRLTQIVEQPVPVRLAAGGPPPGKKDAKGCADFVDLGRFPGSWVKSCKSKRFDEVPVFVWKEGQERAYDRTSVEGQVEHRVYAVDVNTGTWEIIHGIEAKLKAEAWTTKYREVVAGGRNGTLVMTNGADWIKVGPVDSGKSFELARVRSKEVDQFVIATAATMLAQIKATGRVAVYGINFETGKADIKPESEKVLAEVLKMLNESKDLLISVDGHTDNVGGAEMNLELSKKRAEAVKAWLVGKGIEAQRLTTNGFGDTRPLEDNGSDEGRAKNRRVELVKR